MMLMEKGLNPNQVGITSVMSYLTLQRKADGSTEPDEDHVPDWAGEVDQ